MKQLLRLAVLIPALSIANAQAPELTLRIGDPAPSLAGMKGLRGAPPAQYEKGKIYVLDFWATWCGLCPSTYPMMSRLATSEEYKDKVVAVGINTWETRHRKTYDLAEIGAYVDKHGEKVRFDMLVDDEASTVGNAFLKASGAPGLPTLVIVDGEGQVAWIRVGATLVPKHEEEVEKVLREMIAGTFDRETHRKTYEGFVESLRKPETRQ